MKLVLASASPRRRALLEAAEIPFRVAPACVAEREPESGDAVAVALENARAKVDAVLGECVLAADTVVEAGGRLLYKPCDAAHARAMLRTLSGTTHRVVTGVVLRVAGVRHEGAAETRVTMRALADPEIEAYVASGECWGKAGAYAIQETGDRFVSALEGPFDNVVGLPVAVVRELLAEAGVVLEAR